MYILFVCVFVVVVLNVLQPCVKINKYLLRKVGLQLLVNRTLSTQNSKCKKLLVLSCCYILRFWNVFKSSTGTFIIGHVCTAWVHLIQAIKIQDKPNFHNIWLLSHTDSTECWEQNAYVAIFLCSLKTPAAVLTLQFLVCRELDGILWPWLWHPEPGSLRKVRLVPGLQRQPVLQRSPVRWTAVAEVWGWCPAGGSFPLRLVGFYFTVTSNTKLP